MMLHKLLKEQKHHTKRWDVQRDRTKRAVTISTVSNNKHLYSRKLQSRFAFFDHIWNSSTSSSRTDWIVTVWQFLHSIARSKVLHNQFPKSSWIVPKKCLNYKICQTVSVHEQIYGFTGAVHECFLWMSLCKSMEAHYSQEKEKKSLGMTKIKIFMR